MRTGALADHFVGHEVYTVEAAGYKGLKNGALLAAAGKKYDVLVTVDREIEFQQNLRNLLLQSCSLRREPINPNTYRSLSPKFLRL